MKTKSIIITTLALLLTALSAQAQVEIPLNKGYNHDMKVYDDTLFVASENGVFALSLKEGGQAWKQYAFDGMDITTFVKSGQKMIAVQRIFTDSENGRIESQKLLASYDYGRSFADITRYSPENGYCTGLGNIINIHQLPDNPNHILAVYPSNQFFGTFGTTGIVEESFEFGQEWILKDIPFPATGKLSYKSKAPYSILVYGLIPNVDCICPYVFECSNDFHTMTELPIDILDEAYGIEFRDIAYNPSDNERLLAATRKGIAMSTDNGITWKHVVEEKGHAYSFIGFVNVLYDTNNPSTVYAFCNCYDPDNHNCYMELYASTDAGGSWYKAYVSNGHQWETTKVVRNGNNFYFLTMKDEVFSIDISTLPTSISSVKQEAPAQSDAILDLQGRRLDGQPTTKGIVIRDGRKVIVK